MRLATLILTILVFATFASAQDGAGTSEHLKQLKQWTADLQKSPDDQALREKIVKLATTMRPPPEVPREAREHEGAAEYIFKNAKSEVDFLKAAAEYEKTVLVAPWLAADYYNLGVIYEKSNLPAKAVLNYELYLASSPTGAEVDEVVKKIGAMKYAAREADEKRQRDEAQQRDAAAAAERERQRTGGFRALRANVEGRTYRLLICGMSPNGSGRGCTWEEYSGKNWREAFRSWEGQTFTDKYVWEFDSDAAYMKVVFTSSGASQYLIKVVPNGPSIENLMWYSPDLATDSSNTTKYRAWAPINYLRVNGGGTDFIVGFVKAGEDPSANPKAYRHYSMYRTP